MKIKMMLVLILVLTSVFGFATFAEDATVEATTEVPATTEAPATTEVPATEPTTELTDAEKTALLDTLTKEVAVLEAKVVEITAALADTTLAPEAKTAFEAELVTVKASLDLKYEAMAALVGEEAPVTVVMTQKQIKALEYKAKKLESKINRIESWLADEEKALTEEQKAILSKELEAAVAELKELQTTLEAAGSEHPNALRFKNAELLGITPGKMHLLEKLMAVSGDAEVDLEALAAMSVKDIYQTVKEAKQEAKQEAAELKTNAKIDKTKGNVKGSGKK